MNQDRNTKPIRLFLTSALGAGLLVITLLPAEAMARVGGGQSYGGGGHGGGGGGGAGAIIWLIFQLVRLLLSLTIECPIIGIPLDLIVLGGLVYYFARRNRTPQSEIVSAASSGASTGVAPAASDGQAAARGFDQLRRFD